MTKYDINLKKQSCDFKVIYSSRIVDAPDEGTDLYFYNS